MHAAQGYRMEVAILVARPARSLNDATHLLRILKKER